MATAPWIVSNELWELIEPLLPKTERRFRYPGRKRLPDRQADMLLAEPFRDGDRSVVSYADYACL
jgi:transposase